MKGWMFQQSHIDPFLFQSNSNGDVNIHYEDQVNYPKFYIDNNCNLICEYDTWYPELVLDDDLNLKYTYVGTPKLSLDENLNIIYNNDQSAQGAILETMFSIDEDGNLIYSYTGTPMDITMDKYGNIFIELEE